MPRSTKQKFYAVKKGRNGPNIYTTWEETRSAVSGYPGAVHRSFDSMAAAEAYLNEPIPTRASFLVNPFSQRTSSMASSSSRNQYRGTNQRNSPEESLTIPPRPVTSHPTEEPVARPSTPPNNVPHIFIDDELEMVDTGSSACNPIVIPDTPSPRKPSAKPVANWPSDARDEETDPYYAGHRSLGMFKQPKVYTPLQQPAAPLIPEAEPPVIELSEEQQRILDRVKEGRSLFFTGSAGTGKSVLLRAIIIELQRKYGTHAIAVTAPTGIASVNIGGQTLHSFAGIGLGKENVEVLIAKIVNARKSRRRWQDTKVLIIDEISMVDGSLFDKLEKIARTIREDDAPFGGIQLVISGDFFQLPPVPERNGSILIPVVYCFDADTWEACVPECYTLTRVFRQKEQKFIDMLNSMRRGETDPAAVKQFERLKRPLWYDDDIQPTQLFPLKSQVERANTERLNQLPGPTYRYRATDIPGQRVVYQQAEGSRKPIMDFQRLTMEEAEKSLERLVALKEVVLRENAQVMLIQNMKQGRLVNGSLGKIIGFKTMPEAEIDNLEIAKVDRRATAGSKATDDVGIREHDSQMLIQAPKSSQPNLSQGYINQHVLRSQPAECTCGAEFWEGECTCGSENTPVNGTPGSSQDTGEIPASDYEKWPVVQFTSGEVMVLPPVEFTVVSITGVMEAKRVQVPLILSYALSIHKSQGQTLQRVKIDLGGTFEMGQAYVALSRATSLQTLQVLNFNQYKVMADRRVIEWSKTLRISRTGDTSNSDNEGDEPTSTDVRPDYHSSSSSDEGGDANDSEDSGEEEFVDAVSQPFGISQDVLDVEDALDDAAMELSSEPESP